MTRQPGRHPAAAALEDLRTWKRRRPPPSTRGTCDRGRAESHGVVAPAPRVAPGPWLSRVAAWPQARHPSRPASRPATSRCTSPGRAGVGQARDPHREGGVARGDPRLRRPSRPRRRAARTAPGARPGRGTARRGPRLPPRRDAARRRDVARRPGRSARPRPGSAPARGRRGARRRPAAATSASRSIVRDQASRRVRRPGGYVGDGIGHRAARREPRLDPAVEHADARVAEVVEHPPQPRGDRAARVVVGDDVARVVEAEARRGARRMPRGRGADGARDPRAPTRSRSTSTKIAPGRCAAS